MEIAHLRTITIERLSAVPGVCPLSLWGTGEDLSSNFSLPSLYIHKNPEGFEIASDENPKGETRSGRISKPNPED